MTEADDSIVSLQPNKSEVDPRPPWLIKFQAPETSVRTIEIDGTPYPYTIVKSGLAEGLPYAVGYPAEHALFVSEDCPPAYIPYVLAHEVREKVAYAHLSEEERCPAALREELADVAVQHPEMAEEYTIERLAFFEALVTLYQIPKQRETKTPAFLRGIENSRDFLTALVAPLESA